MQKRISYIDMHCDSLTAGRGNLTDESLHVSIGKLARSGAAAQCFAVFTDGDGAAERFAQALGRYNAAMEENGDRMLPVFCCADLVRARDSDRVGAILTVENLGFIGGDLSAVAKLGAAGVKMCSLVWNNANALAYPNLVCKDGIPDFTAREERGLTDLGKAAVEELNANRMMIDVSHLSDGGVNDVLALSDAPVVASHSNCFSVCGVSRNLTDGQIRKIADGGGVIGVNFCRDFVGNGEISEAVSRHIRHLVSVGGEDCVALGSDFDGIPTAEGMEDCTRIPAFLGYLHGLFGPRIAEKFAHSNFVRVFRDVVG